MPENLHKFLFKLTQKSLFYNKPASQHIPKIYIIPVIPTLHNRDFIGLTNHFKNWV